MKLYLFSILLFFPLLVFTQNQIPNIQPTSGLGGSQYLHQEVKQYDYASKPDGFWLYEPAEPKPDSANVIVFIHGYGAYNPMIYGRWIKHLVRKGNIVIFPRYQRNLISPGSKRFVNNVSTAIKDALKELEKETHVKAITKDFALVGHSYGGVISANLAVNFEKYNIPQPKAVMLCSAGTGPLKGGLLKSYNNMPSDVKLLVMVSEDDRVVGDEISKLVFSTTTNVLNKNYIIQKRDRTSEPYLTAHHDESYALDQAFDSGVRNYTAKKALRIGRTNSVDYFGYWKLFDALLDCTRNGENCSTAFGNTAEQRYLGKRKNGNAFVELEVIVPTKWLVKKQTNN